MSAKKVPRGGFNMVFLEEHNSKMKRVLCELHQSKKNTSSTFSKKTLKWSFITHVNKNDLRFPSFRGRQLGIGKGSQKTSLYVTVWDIHAKAWNSLYFGGGADSWVRFWYTEGCNREIGAGV